MNTSRIFITVVALTLAACHSTLPNTSSIANGSSDGSATDFAIRCAAPGVVRCFGFDSLADVSNTGPISGAAGLMVGDDDANCSNGSCRSIDSSIRASGNGSLRFEIPANSGENSSGAWHNNFSDDYSVQFGPGDTFYVQWRQRFSPEMISTVFPVTSGEGGWKQIIIGEGSRAAPEPGWPDGYPAWSSCTLLEVVLQNIGHYGFPRAYHRCGTYEQLVESYGAYDFKLQNRYDLGDASTPRYCLYSSLSSERPTTGCFQYYANEWMTFQIRVKVGNWNDRSTQADVWMAREGQSSVHIISSTTLRVGEQVAGYSRYGKIWLTPFNTAKSRSASNPVTYTWYDELIISRNFISDPQ